MVHIYIHILGLRCTYISALCLYLIFRLHSHYNCIERLDPVVITVPHLWLLIFSAKLPTMALTGIRANHGKITPPLASVARSMYDSKRHNAMEICNEKPQTWYMYGITSNTFGTSTLTGFILSPLELTAKPCGNLGAWPRRKNVKAFVYFIRTPGPEKDQACPVNCIHKCSVGPQAAQSKYEADTGLK